MFKWQQSGTELSPTIPFDGIPFKSCGRILFQCHQGVDKNVKQKQKYKENKEARQVYQYAIFKYITFRDRDKSSLP